MQQARCRAYASCGLITGNIVISVMLARVHEGEI